jgi:hypothetical protein
MDDSHLDWRPNDQHLPSTQHIVCDYSTPGCSKALRGLRLQVEVTGLCASNSQFRRTYRGDSGTLVVPFMQVAN